MSDSLLTAALGADWSYRTVLQSSWLPRQTCCKGIGSQVHSGPYGKYQADSWINQIDPADFLLHLQETAETDRNWLWPYRGSKRRSRPLDKDRGQEGREIPVRRSYHLELLTERRATALSSRHLTHLSRYGDATSLCSGCRRHPQGHPPVRLLYRLRCSRCEPRRERNAEVRYRS